MYLGLANSLLVSIIIIIIIIISFLVYAPYHEDNMYLT